MLGRFLSENAAVFAKDEKMMFPELGQQVNKTPFVQDSLLSLLQELEGEESVF